MFSEIRDSQDDNDRYIHCYEGEGFAFGYQVTEQTEQVLNCFWNRIAQKTYVLAEGLDPSQ